MLEFFIWFIMIGVFVEITTYVIVTYVNKKFQWLIIERDEKPKILPDALGKFIEHGYDPELGWVRKPNTWHLENGKYGQTKWNTNSNAARHNPDFEELESKISCYGDSFAFCRQVNDSETWEHFLSKMLHTNVKNFGVGNYGVDQALLRLKREYTKNRTPIVIMAVVPDTISRILSIWKHYYEYGNTFGFKPRFQLKNDILVLVENPINNKDKFLDYENALEHIKVQDYFYNNKFVKEKIRFPYSISIFRNMSRNFSIIFWILMISVLKKSKKSNQVIQWKPMQVVMRINLQWRVKLYADKDAVQLLKKLVEEYVKYVHKENSIPVFVFIPQKDDVLFVKKNYHFYKNIIKELQGITGIYLIDILDYFLNEEQIDQLYSDNNDYGGHLSIEGNMKVASIIYQKLIHRFQDTFGIKE
jgi:hypothetical protein